jgi:hypothetical protein
MRRRELLVPGRHHRLAGWHQDLIDVGEEQVAIHRLIQEAGRGLTVDAQRHDEGARLPVMMPRVIGHASAGVRLPTSIQARTQNAVKGRDPREPSSGFPTEEPNFVLGRPDRPFACVHLRAISCRCHRRMVSGVTIAATWHSPRRPNRDTRTRRADAVHHRSAAGAAHAAAPVECDSPRSDTPGSPAAPIQPADQHGEQHSQGEHVNHGGRVYITDRDSASQGRWAELRDYGTRTPRIDACRDLGNRYRAAQVSRLVTRQRTC